MDLSELEDGTPPSLEFVSLADRRGSLRSLHASESNLSERRRSSAWESLEQDPNGRRGSGLLAKRNAELAWGRR